ncbi:RNA pseudouridylate synthase domain containing protein 2, partial [Rhizophlyctis rosea]
MGDTIETDGPSVLGKRPSVDIDPAESEDPNCDLELSALLEEHFAGLQEEQDVHEDKRPRVKPVKIEPVCSVLEIPDDGAISKDKPVKKRRDFASSEKKELQNCHYYFEDGLRKVFPYFFKFQTFAKGRWLNRTIYEVFSSEFQDKPKEYYKQAIEVGAITVNGEIKSLDYVLKNADLVEHLIHRHEPPVSADAVEIVNRKNKDDPTARAELADDIVVISKPSSIPIHPTGRYHHNTLLHILRHDYPEITELYPVNRIDRLTSGICLMARKKAACTLLMNDMQKRQVDKHYLARVRGEFPKDYFECTQPIKTVSFKLGVNTIHPDGKYCRTGFKRLSYNGRTSVVWCRPFTGRTHQIRVHLQYLGYPIANDPVYCTDFWGPKLGKDGVSEEGAKEVVDKLLEKGYVQLEHEVLPHDAESVLAAYKEWFKPLEDGNAEEVEGREEEEKDGAVKEGEGSPSTSTTPLPRLPRSGPSPMKSTLTPQEILAIECCRDCTEKRRGFMREDPKPEYLQIWLHSIRYSKKRVDGVSGVAWEFETPPPEWARPKWRGCEVLEERFWKFGG